MAAPIYLLFLFALLNSDERRLLQDAGGWEYIKMSDPDNGIQTTHTCFDGRPHPEQCSGSLMLTPNKNFVQSVHIHGQTVRRHGTYRLDDDQLVFFDEFGTQDGPYAVSIDTETKRLVLEMPQIRIELELRSQYRKDMQAAKQQPK